MPRHSNLLTLTQTFKPPNPNRHSNLLILTLTQTFKPPNPNPNRHSNLLTLTPFPTPGMKMTEEFVRTVDQWFGSEPKKIEYGAYIGASNPDTL